MNVKKRFVCVLILCGIHLFGANDVPEGKKERTNPLWESFKHSEYYGLYKTSSSDEKEGVQEEAKDAHAEADTASTSDGSSSGGYGAQHTLTPPYPHLRQAEVVDYMDTTDRVMLAKMSHFCQSTVLMHDVVTYLLQEQRQLKRVIETFQGELLALRDKTDKNGALIDYVADQACHIATCRHNREKIIISINALNEKCKGLDKKSTYIEETSMIACFEMRKRVDELFGQCAQIHVLDAQLQRVERIVEELECMVQRSSSASSASEQRCIGRQKQKKLLAPVHSEDSESISPFMLSQQPIEVHEEKNCPRSPEEQGAMVISPFDLDATQQSTQKLLEKTGNTAV